MKFEKGQKVRVKKWLDMPQDSQDAYGCNIIKLGEIGTILKFVGDAVETDDYDVIFEGDKYPVYLFGPELESAIAVGEQLLFSFMSEKEE